MSSEEIQAKSEDDRMTSYDSGSRWSVVTDSLQTTAPFTIAQALKVRR